MSDRVTEHALRVLDGEKGHGKLHILSCKRHLDDLKKQNTSDFPYYWDEAAAADVINFSETLSIVEGAFKRNVNLIDCQAFDIGSTFGWKQSVTGNRRFRRRYKSVARQNGKTFENGIMGTYILGFSKYKYGKAFAVATKKRQARLAWEEVKKFIEGDEDLSEYFKIQDYKSLITALNTQSTFEALSREGGLDEGFRSIFASVDEIHQHRDNSIYKAIYNGTRSLPETLVSMITTRGNKLNSFCKEMDDYAIKILSGTAKADDFFIDIYCPNEEDDLFSPDAMIKANPFIFTDEERVKTLLSDAETAKDMGGADLRDFVIKCLNMWVMKANDQFVNPDKWKQCGSRRKLSDIVKAGYKNCFVGLDLSSGGDLTTLCLEFPIENDKIYIHSHSFMPLGRVEEHVETDLAPYDYWISKGLITTTGGSNDFMTDYKFIISYLFKLKQEYGLNFIAIGADPHNIAGILQDLEEFACPVIQITQSARNLNDATVDIQLLVKSGKVEYDIEDELLSWSMINAALVRNSFGEVKIDKKPHQKHSRIDPDDAFVDAHAVRLITGITESKDKQINNALDEYLNKMGWS